ncbi:unnamed protein product (macronuclear) [Paramecium tetraurelia]|uniref:Transmembrane protein n=1 Tax=Paramecium tetraurelia TaxID=5888 RepID=A0DKM7_PARTE|nr:uncharacterized protein GSPATT00017924001 [Paramecium tetraurelia]CAK83594.1 unnamed protein product [Paramecium tetraurelia]|eukprot:XP_001450991.1 hypothetical protein (macronuclear) [Paramecium tetraurelia strain d4-2]
MFVDKNLPFTKSKLQKTDIREIGSKKYNFRVSTKKKYSKYQRINNSKLMRLDINLYIKMEITLYSQIYHNESSDWLYQNFINYRCLKSADKIKVQIRQIMQKQQISLTKTDPSNALYYTKTKKLQLLVSYMKVKDTIFLNFCCISQPFLGYQICNYYVQLQLNSCYTSMRFLFQQLC